MIAVQGTMLRRSLLVMMLSGVAIAADSQPASRPAGTTSSADGEFIKFSTGTLFVPTDFHASREVDVLVFFHGDPATVARNCRVAEIDAVVVMVNFRGLSAAYSKPLADRALFGRILDEALKRLVDEKIVAPEARWGRLCVGSFSAGFGAVREILKDRAYFDRIDGLLLADSLYAGYSGDPSARQINVENLADFRRFAKAAAEGCKTMIVSHSQLVPGTYASTIETADDLIHWVGGERSKVTDPAEKGPLGILSRCRKGQFQVYGCEGTDAEAHMRHLRQSAPLLGHLPVRRRPASQPVDGR